MMKQVLLAVAFNAIRSYVGSGVFDRIYQLVLDLEVSLLDGSSRREEVLKFARVELDMIQTHIIDAIISVILLRKRA